MAILFESVPIVCIGVYHAQGSGCGEIGDTTRKQEKESLGTYFWWVAAGGGDSEAEP